MKTNGGAHPADYYAGVAAAEIVSIEADKEGADVVQGRKLENEIIDILEAAHDKLLAAEQDACEDDHDHVLSELNPYEHGLDEVVGQILEAGKRSKWASHFSSKATESYIRQVVGKHFVTAQYVTRSYHLDNNPDHPHVVSFKQKHHTPANVK